MHYFTFLHHTRLQPRPDKTQDSNVSDLTCHECHQQTVVDGVEVRFQVDIYHLATLWTMLGVAVQWRRLRKAPKVKLLRLPQNRKVDFLDFEEAKRLVESARSEPVWAAMIIVALNTGLRQGELLALRWADCDLDAKQLTVSQRNWRGHIDSPKSGKGRVVPLNALALDALAKLPRVHDLVWRPSRL